MVSDDQWFPGPLSDERTRRLYLRLTARVVPGTDGCRLWGGATVTGGYGRVSVGGKLYLVHRIFYELAYGPIPTGLQLHHRCERPNCVNPAHLVAVTPREHMHLTPQGVSGQWIGATHCKHGHEFTPENTIISARGQRRCRTCHRAVNRAADRRRRAANGKGEGAA